MKGKPGCNRYKGITDRRKSLCKGPGVGRNLMNTVGSLYPQLLYPQIQPTSRDQNYLENKVTMLLTCTMMVAYVLNM